MQFGVKAANYPLIPEDFVRNKLPGNVQKYQSKLFGLTITLFDQQRTGALLGVVRMMADPDYQRAEFAVLVASDLKGQGLGRTLMLHLIKYASAEGLLELYGEVLAENSTMLAFCQRLGFEVREDPGDAEMRHVVLPLGAGALDRPPGAHTRRATATGGTSS